MKKSTDIRLTAIQNHIQKNFRRWIKAYTNIEGAHAGFKIKDNKTIKNRYSIVFHVTEKKERPKKLIPPFMTVKIGDKREKIPTDVIATKQFELTGIKIGDQTQNENTSIVGTISFYFETPRGLFFCSNMHVLAPNFIRKKKTNYDVRKGDPPQRVLLFDKNITATGQLIVARFNGVDLAFARIDNPLIPAVIEREFKNVGPVKGIFELTNTNFRKVNASFVGSISGHQQCTIDALGAFKRTAIENVFLTNLIKLERCTQDGDSGSALIDSKNRLLGIVIGRDEEASYAMHLNDIIDFFQTSKL